MFECSSNLPQWSELGEQLAGPDGEGIREQILYSLEALKHKAERELLTPQVDAPRVSALIEAIQTARNLAESLFKPVDLSNL